MVANGAKAVGTGLLSRESQDRILISGTHRSGTTWLGSVLEAGRVGLLINEPFSKERGIVGVEHWFPCCTPEQPLYRELIDRFFLTHRARYKPNIPGRSRLRSLGRYVFPDEQQRRLGDMRVDPPQRLIVKDPLASLLADHLIAAFGFKVVFTVKHPYAFYDSLLRVGWETSLPLEDLWQQLRGADGLRDAALIWEPAERAAIIWRTIYQNALRLTRHYHRHCLIVRHEDMCAKPLRTLREITDFLSIPLDPAMEAYVQRTTSGTLISPDRSVVHELRRNSTALPERWKQSVSLRDRDILRRGTSDVGEMLYPDPW